MCTILIRHSIFNFVISILIPLGRNAPFAVRSLLRQWPLLIASRVSKKPFSELTFPLEFSNQCFSLHASDSDHLPSVYACKVDVYLFLILPRTRSNHGVPRLFFSLPSPLGYYISNNRFAAIIHINMLYNDLLLAFATIAYQRLCSCIVKAKQLSDIH